MSPQYNYYNISKHPGSKNPELLYAPYNDGAGINTGHPVGPVNLTVVYHNLGANEGDMDYGTELGFVAGTKVGPVGLTLKYADYSADEYATDTTKLWLMAAMTF